MFGGGPSRRGEDGYVLRMDPKDDLETSFDGGLGVRQGDV